MNTHRNPQTLARRTNGNHRQQQTPMVQNRHLAQNSKNSTKNPGKSSKNGQKSMKNGQNQRKRPRQSRVEQEIRDLQASTDPILPKTRFRLIVKELLQVYMTDMMVEKEALDALQSAAEEHLVKLFTATNKITTRSGRATIKKEDLELVMDLLENQR